eukprot:Awhi_evm1s8100
MNFDDIAEGFKQTFNGYAAATKRDLEKASQDLDLKREQLEAETRAFQLEKEKMQNAHTSMQDVMLLNVSGKLMHSTRKTLCLYENSFLASMFSGRWEQNLNRDANGNILLNFDPHAFAYVLRFLRLRELLVDVTEKIIVEVREKLENDCAVNA